jgi:hypothetical protein
MVRISCFLFIVFHFLFSDGLFAQDNRVTVGLEQDVLPYIFGGYFGNIWVGKGHWRARVLVAKVNKPDFLIPKKFSNNRVTAYAVLGDYFLKSEWKGPWIGAGLVKWESSIQDKARTSTTHFNNWLLNGSLGYNWKIYKHFYAGPWMGLHIRVGGDKRVTVDTKTFEPPLLNPEASIKMGWYF